MHNLLKKPLTPADSSQVLSQQEGIPAPQSPVLPPPINRSAESAPELAHRLLDEHHLKPHLILVDGLNVWDGKDGFLLHDKPLLKLTFIFEGK